MTKVRVRGWFLAVLLTIVVLTAPLSTAVVEYSFSRGVYPVIQEALTPLSNLLSLAVLDFLLVGVAGYLLFRFVRFIQDVQERGVRSALWELTRRLLRTAALIVLTFLGVWGLNYRRIPLEQVLRGGAPETVSADEIRGLADRAVAGTHVTRPANDAPVDRSFGSVATRLSGPFHHALTYLGMPSTVVVGHPKTSAILTPFFTAAGVTGMVNPFGLEAIVHPGLLPFERPMVLAHEWAHLAGVADEADASAIAWLACTEGDPDLRYSAHLFVVLEASSAMPGQAWQALRPTLDPGVVEDINALARRLVDVEPVVREKAFAVYDGYLRTNSVADGVRSYSRVLRVLAAMSARNAPKRPGTAR